jgi:aconitate hydratase
MVTKHTCLVTSPEMVAALAIAGRLDFNPLTDTLLNERRRSEINSSFEMNCPKRI